MDIGIPLGRIGAQLKLTAQNWIDHDAPRIGAALAFYTLLAFAPLVLFTVTISALLFKSDIGQQLIHEVNQLAGAEASRLAQTIVERPRTPSSGVGASIVGFVTLLIGASGIFAGLRSSLNTMWNIPAKTGNGIILWIKSRLRSMGMVMAGGFLLMVSLIVSALLAVLGKYVGGILPAPAYVLEALNFLISLAGGAILFALILRYIPDERLPWRTISTGAVVTAFLFTVGKSLIGIYLGRSAIGSPYGPGGSILVVMAWVYYSAQIFLFGAEFTRTLARADVVAVPS